jgi:hypothetical protein
VLDTITGEQEYPRYRQFASLVIEIFTVNGEDTIKEHAFISAFSPLAIFYHGCQNDALTKAQDGVASI